MKGRFESEGISCWLKDEHLSAIIVDPILTNAIAGIKLMVRKEDLEKAIETLNNGEQRSEDGEINE